MEITKKTRRDYDKSGSSRREYAAGSNSNRERDSKPYSERRASKSFGDKPYSEHRASKSFGDKPYSEHRASKSFGDKPYGERDSKPYSEHRASKSFGDKPYSERRSTKPFADGKPYGERDSKPYSERRASKSFGDKPYSERRSTKPFADGKPYGERRSSSFGDKPYSERSSKPYPERPAGRPYARKPKAAPQAPATEVRLNKFIANSGVCSRREADRLIQAGVVTVNGQVVTELGTRIDIRRDTVLFGDQKLRGEEKVYIIMNKPKGFVTTTSDPHAEQTVMDLLTKCPTRVFPVGRLDKNTTGVLLFTNDGELSEKLTHPSFNKKKVYEVSLDKDLTQEDFEKILSGIQLEDGPIKADDLHYVDAESRRVLGIEIHSGRNRIVRRIFESQGYQVRGLDRVLFAGLSKKGIKRGQWRYLSEGEVNLLKMGAFN